MPELDLEAIEARARAATPGPWVPVAEDPACPFPPEIVRRRSWRISTPDDADPRSAGIPPQDRNLPIAVVDSEHKGDREAWANRDFIAAARTDVPDLVAEVRRLAAENAALRTELEAGPPRATWAACANAEPGSFVGYARVYAPMPAPPLYIDEE